MRSARVWVSTCEQLIRSTSAPASTIALITAGSSEAGPMVAMIFVCRINVQSRRFLVSKGGLEPPRPFERQPLKLVRLPISPLRRGVELST